MRRRANQLVLQITYDSFRSSGGIWPTLGYVERELNCQTDEDVDAVKIIEIIQRIPPTLLKKLSPAAGYPLPGERLVLTLEGIARCKGSKFDVKNALTAIRWLARWAEHPDLSDLQDTQGVRFTMSQLAEAVSLSLDSDQEAISRLVAILEAEGWA